MRREVERPEQRRGWDLTAVLYHCLGWFEKVGCSVDFFFLMLQGQTVFHYEKPELTASFLAYLFIYLFKNMNAFIKCATIYTYLANSLCPFGFRCMGMYFPHSQDPKISEYSRLLKRGFLMLFLKCQKTGHIDFRRIVPINVKIKVINSLLRK